MKQKIVVKVQMNCQKCRTKALQIAASLDGVEKVSFEGDEKDKVVVIGDAFDPIRLIKCLKKKVGHAQILTLDEVKLVSEGKPKKPKSPPTDTQPVQYDRQPHFVGFDVVYEPNPSYCSVM